MEIYKITNILNGKIYIGKDFPKSSSKTSKRYRIYLEETLKKIILTYEFNRV